MNKDSRILVTGSRGMIGRTLCSLLKAQGYTDVREVYGTDLRIHHKTAELFKSILPDYVFHCAAKVYGIGGNSRSPADILVDNVQINTNVVACSRIFAVKKIVVMGSGCVYPAGPEEWREDQVWNGSPHPSEGSYAHAKRLMLAHLHAEKQQYKLNYAYVISGNLYGPYDKFNVDTGHVIPSLAAKFYKSAREDYPVSVWGRGIAVRDFMYSEDAAEALIQIMLKSEGPINMGSGNHVEIKTIVRHLQAIHRDTVKVEWDHTKPDGQEKRVYNLDKLNQIFKAKVSLGDGLTKTVEWLAANYNEARK